MVDWTINLVIDRDLVGDVETRILAHVLDPAYQLPGQALGRQFRGYDDVNSHGDQSVRRYSQPLAGIGLHQDLFRSQFDGLVVDIQANLLSSLKLGDQAIDL